MSGQIKLNIVPISFNKKKVEIGRLPKLEKEAYQELREQHWKTHAFRYDHRSEEIFNVSLVPNQRPIGRIELVDINEHLLLMAKAIQRDILVWLADSLTILRGDKKLVFWGKVDNALLLSQAVKDLRLEKVPDLEVALRYEIDCRLFWHSQNEPFLGLVIDLATSNIIDIPVSKLLEDGLTISGRYVCYRQEEEIEQEYLLPRLELIGKVVRQDGSNLLLTDTESTTEVQSKDVFLEPTLQNLQDVIRLYYGANAGKVLAKLQSYRSPINTATDKLKKIQTTLQGLKDKHPIVVADNLEISLGSVLDQSNKLFPLRISVQRPTLLFGPQGRNTGTIPDHALTEMGPYMYMQHERNAPLIVVVCEAQFRGRIEQFIELLRSGFPNEQWKNPNRDNPYRGGLLGKYRLANVRIVYEECNEPTPQAYEEAAHRLLNRLSEVPDLAIVQIREGFKQLYGNHNPYFVIKSAFMMADVPVQAIQIEKITTINENTAYLLNTISLSIYAKLDGIPWVISTVRPTTHELVVGIGSSQISTRRLGTTTQYVGITTVFQGDGRYLVWGATREVKFEDYPKALLESLRANIEYVRYHNAWQKGEKVRLVCHVYKRLRDCEVDAVKSLVRELVENFDVEFAFLDISWWHPYHIFDPNQTGVTYYDLENRQSRIKGIGVPERGLSLQLDNRRALLQLIGPRETKTSSQGLPNPLLIELHTDSDFTDLTYLVRQIYHFSYMSWRSFMPASEPVTIAYSQLIARLLGNLKTVSDWNSQVLAGGLRDRRWFL